MSPVLTHGDLWAANLLSRCGRIAVIDPAACYMWAETDLSMLWSCPRAAAASGRSFDLYQELNPSPPGCADRMPILHLRELLSTAVNFGARPPAFSSASATSSPLSLTQRRDSGAALGCPLLSPQPGSFTKLRKKSSTCRIASVKRSRLTGLVYALACNW
jgi:hypothetical protein